MSGILNQTQASNFAILNNMKEFNGDLELRVER